MILQPIKLIILSNLSFYLQYFIGVYANAISFILWISKIYIPY